MKPILLKTLAAVSLTASSPAEVHVLGASWKERGVDASSGAVDIVQGTVAAPRAYLVFDPSLLTETPLPATKIEYSVERAGGATIRTYTIDSEFTGFHADTVTGVSEGRRLYGNIHAPVALADVTGATVPFIGGANSAGYPRKLSFDTTAFVTGSTTGTAGPRLAPVGNGTAKRSVISGGANMVTVSATTTSGAVAELEARLIKAGYSRGAVAPEIATDLKASIPRDGYKVEVLSIELGDDVYPTPGYQWFKDDSGGTPVAIPGATSATYNVAAGTPGDGTYSVVLTTSGFPSVSSGKAVVTTNNVAMSFTTDLPATKALAADATDTLVPVVNSNAFPQPATYQWQTSSTGDAASFTNIAAADGGTLTFLTVGGGGSALHGPGFYRVLITNGPTQTLTSATTQVTTSSP